MGCYSLLHYKCIVSLFVHILQKVPHGSGLHNVPPQIYIHPEFQSVDLFGRRVFADVIKDPEMKSSWI